MMNRAQAEELVRKYNTGIASKAEINLLERWYVQQAARQHVSTEEEDYLQVSREMWQAIQKEKAVAPTRRLWSRYVAAACLLLCIGLTVFYNWHGKDILVSGQQQATRDIAPGKNAATLTLANGKQLVLTDVSNGEIASQAGTAVTKTADGKLIYQTTETEESSIPVFNTLVTARGQQYQLVLPDGTSVWLNAETSLKFPASFGKQSLRAVALIGQAYFEVKKDPKHPFVVTSGKQKVEVLGTHFDICSYANEPVRTTLLEGSVSVSSLDPFGKKIGSKILKPGQQSVLGSNATVLEVNTVDAEYVVAWKNGFFQFDNTDIKTVMQQLARWYDIEVEYAGAIPQETFSGKVYRNMSLSKVLEILSFSQINFEVKGRKMTIYPNKNK